MRPQYPLPRCTLHIGAPKTGSTALQEFLSNNAAALQEQGYVYPRSGLRANGHHDIAFLSGGGYPEWATPQSRGLEDLTTDLRNEIANTPHHVILSSENFYLLRQPAEVGKLLTSLFPGGAVKVVVYLRRQDEAHLSWYNQAVKAQGFTGTIEDSIRDNDTLWNYAENLAHWTDVFGEENLIIRIYQNNELIDGDIRRDFCRLLQVTEAPLRFQSGRSNTALNRSLLEFQRTRNALPLPMQEKRRFHKQLTALSEVSAGQGMFDESMPLCEARRRELLAHYAPGNRQLAKRFFARDVLFDESMPAAHAGDGAPAALSAEALACIEHWLSVERNEAA